MWGRKLGVSYRNLSRKLRKDHFGTLAVVLLVAYPKVQGKVYYGSDTS